MKLLCEVDKFKQSVANGEDRKAADKYFDARPGMSCVLVGLPDRKTFSQNNAIWRDWSEAARLLGYTKEQIYAEIQLSDDFADLFYVDENYSLRTGERIPRFRGLSELNKEETKDLITRYREWLQSWIDSEYGEPVPVEWSRDERKEELYLQSKGDM